MTAQSLKGIPRGHLLNVVDSFMSEGFKSVLIQVDADQYTAGALPVSGDELAAAADVHLARAETMKSIGPPEELLRLARQAENMVPTVSDVHRIASVLFRLGGDVEAEAAMAAAELASRGSST